MWTAAGRDIHHVLQMLHKSTRHSWQWDFPLPFHSLPRGSLLTAQPHPTIALPTLRLSPLVQLHLVQLMLFPPLSQLGVCSSSANSSSLASERVGHVVALVNAVNLDPALVCIQPRLYWYSPSAEAYPKMQEESAEFRMSRSLLYLRPSDGSGGRKHTKEK